MSIGIPVEDIKVVEALEEVDAVGFEKILELIALVASITELGVSIAELVLGLDDLINVTEHISGQVDVIAGSQIQLLSELITIDNDVKIGFTLIDNELNIISNDIVTELKIFDIDIVKELQTVDIDIVNEIQIVDKDIVNELEIIDNDVVNQLILVYKDIANEIEHSTDTIVNKLTQIDKNIINALKNIKCAINANGTNICNKLDAIYDFLKKLYDARTTQRKNGIKCS
jgi:hypothetical protein